MIPRSRLVLGGLAAAVFAAPAEAGPAVGYVAISPAGECAPNAVDRTLHALAQSQLGRRDAAKGEPVGAVVEATKARAVAELRATVCARLTGPQCDRVRARISVEHAVDLARGVVCAVALVSTEAANDPDGLGRDAEAVAALADRLAERGAPVSVAPARWASGCGAGDAGAWITASLRAGLAAAGARVELDAGEAAPRLEPVLVPGPTVRLEVWRRAPGAAPTLAGSEALSASWGSATAGACRTDAALGAGPRAAGPLVASLDLVGPDLLCVGETTKAVLAWSGGPAAAQVWSVAADGTAWLLWLGSPGSGPVRMDLEASWAERFGEERLVALLAPAASALPAGAVGCRAASFAPPAGVTVAATSLQVLRPGRDRCPALPASELDAAWAASAAAPPCR